VYVANGACNSTEGTPTVSLPSSFTGGAYSGNTRCTMGGWLVMMPVWSK
jgi:hypothetical protein